MKKEELNKILADHKEWLGSHGAKNGKTGFLKQ